VAAVLWLKTSMLLLVMTGVPGPVGDVARKARDNVGAMGKGLLDWDMWRKDPARAFTNVVLNVVSFAVPGGGEVAGGVKTALETVAFGDKAAAVTAGTLRAVDVMADASKGSRLVFRASRMAGGVETVLKLPSQLLGKGFDALFGPGRRLEAGLGRAGADAVQDTARAERATQETAQAGERATGEAGSGRPRGEPGVKAEPGGPVAGRPERDTGNAARRPEDDTGTHSKDAASADHGDAGGGHEPPPAGHDTADGGKAEPDHTEPGPDPGSIVDHGVKSALDNALDHGVDPSQVDPLAVTQVPLDVAVTHSSGFADAGAAHATAHATNQVALEARNAILRDLHDTHGIDINKRDLQGSRAKDRIAVLVLDHAADGGAVGRLQDLCAACDVKDGTRVDLVRASEKLGSAGGDDLLASLGVRETHGGPGVGKDSFDKWGLTSDRDEMIVVEEKGGAARLSQEGRVLPDGVRAPQGSTAYFMDVARNDAGFRSFLKDPANGDVVAGLKDGSVAVRYIVECAPGDGKIITKDLVLNPNSMDWSWLSGGG